MTTDENKVTEVNLDAKVLVDECYIEVETQLPADAVKAHEASSNGINDEQLDKENILIIEIPSVTDTSNEIESAAPNEAVQSLSELEEKVLAEEPSDTNSTMVEPPVHPGTSIISDLHRKIIQQVEFYFSDANLSKDRHLKLQLKNAKDRWLSIASIASFSRMKTLTENLADIVDALKLSKHLEVSQDSTKLRRVIPFTGDRDTTGLVLLATGFPIEATLDEILAFFNDIKPVAIVRRRMSGEAFTGSAWVEFESTQDRNDVAKMSLTLKELPLTFILKEECGWQDVSQPDCLLHYECNVMPKDLLNKLKKHFETTHGPILVDFERKGKAALGLIRLQNGNATKVLESLGDVIFDGVAITFRMSSEEEITAYWTKMLETKFKATKKSAKGSVDKENAAAAEINTSYEKNCIVKVKLVEAIDGVTIDQYKKTFAKYGKVKFVDIAEGGTSGFVRYAVPIEQDLAEGVVIKDVSISMQLLTDAYWKSNVIPTKPTTPKFQNKGKRQQPSRKRKVEEEDSRPSKK